MSVYTFEHKINSDRLTNEIRGLPFGSALERIDTRGETDVSVFFQRALNEVEQQQLDAVVAQHNPIAIEEEIGKKIQSAIQFGQSLVIEFGTMNVQSNRSSVEIMQMMGMLQNVMLLLMVGSLYTAIDAIDAIPVTELTPIELKNYFKWKIQDYLEISRT